QDTARNLYAADIKGASVALADHDLAGARKLLNQIAASPSQRDLRGWEWRYLMDQSRRDPPLGRHGKWIDRLAFSPDDQVLISISGDGVIKAWDWRSRKELYSWQAHAPILARAQMIPAHSVIFLPGTSLLASTGADQVICFWKLGSTDPVAQFASPSS